MIDEPRIPLSSGVDVRDEIDRLCDEFESAWREGRPQRIEDCLAEAPETLRSHLLRELLLSELECRTGSGESPSADDYVTRFPRDRTLIEDVFAAASRAGNVPALRPGRQIDGYEVQEEIGRGGMGVVYKARQRELDRIVALKVILSGAHAGNKERARFRHEAVAAARLQHPHIVQVHDVGEADGLPYIAMEYVAGESLDHLLARSHAAGSVAMSPRDAATLVRTLAEAIHHAHGQGIVHRDLKPANVLLQVESRELRVESEENDANSSSRSLNSQPSTLNPRITDFGLAKTLDARGQSTRTGALLGTPTYMAPEQASGGKLPVGPPTDVYALGVMLYELLTGRTPFRGLSILETLEQVRHRDPVPPRQLQPGVPRDLETICLKCLQKDPARRFTTAEAFADDLGRFLRNEPVRARPVTAWNRVWKWMRRRPAVTGLLAALVAVIVVSFAAIAWQLRKTNEALEQSEEETSARRVALARFHYGAYEVEKARELLLECPERFRDNKWRQARRAIFAEEHRMRPEAVVRKVFWSPDGRHVIGCSVDGRLFRWHADTGKLLDQYRWRETTEMAAHKFALSSDGKTFYCLQLKLRQQGEARVVPIQLAGRKPTRGKVMSVALRGTAATISGTGRLALDIRDRNGVQTTVTDLTSGKMLMHVKHKRGTFSAGGLQFSPDGTRLVRMVSRRSIALFDVATGRRIYVITPNATFNRHPAFDPDGKWVAFSFLARPVRLLNVYEAATGKPLTAIRVPNLPGALVTDIASNKRIAWTAERSALYVAPVRSGQVDLPLNGHTDATNDLAFSPDGNRLASCSQDGTVRIWDVRPPD